MLGVSAFKKHTRILVNMSDAYVENRGVWVKCSYNKARNDYIKTRDNITDSVVFHFDDDENVIMGDILVFNDTRYLLGNLTPDTFFKTKMRKRSAGIELHFKCDVYSVDTTYEEGVGNIINATYKYRNVWYAMLKDAMDNEKEYLLPFDIKSFITSSIYNLELGDGIVTDIGRFYVRDVDHKMPGGNRFMVSRDTRDVVISE